MARLKNSKPHQIRLSRETVNILDEVSDDLGGLSRRAAIELVTRFVGRVKSAQGTTFADLLLKDHLPADAELV